MDAPGSIARMSTSTRSAPRKEPHHTAARPQRDLERPPHAHATAHLRRVAHAGASRAAWITTSNSGSGVPLSPHSRTHPSAFYRPADSGYGVAREHACLRVEAGCALSSSFARWCLTRIAEARSFMRTSISSISDPSPPREPCSFREDRLSTTSNATSSSVTTTRDQRSTTARASRRCIRTHAQKPKRSSPRTTTRGLSSSTTAPSVLSRRLRATRYGGSGQLFCGADIEVVRRGPALACGCADVAPAFFDTLHPLRARPVRAVCPCPSSFVQHAPRTALLHVELADVGDLAGILILLQEGGGVALWLSRLFARHAFPLSEVFVSPPSSVRAVYSGPLTVARWMDVGRMSWCIHRQTTELTSHFVFHCYCIYLPADYISTRSIPPCTTRVIVGCSWLLLVVLELNLFARRSPPEPSPSLPVLTVHGNAIGVPRMPSHFPPAGHSHPAAVHFHHQAGTFQLEVRGPPTQAAGFETAGREISRLPASRALRTFLFTVPFYSSIPISLLSHRIVHFIYTPTLPALFVYAMEMQVYSPPISLPMDTDNTVKKSEWTGRQRSWAIAPPALKEIAAQWFLIPQELEHNLLPSPYLPIEQMLEFPLPLQNAAPVTTDHWPAQFFSANVPDISDEALMLRRAAVAS
ncbi:hypothetical protein B0H13DRAFT_2335376 [Mycena leptocephala]|nr:hypothetical protein B0H13DRAFT_2335376 [Mycena leptocephala]